MHWHRVKMGLFAVLLCIALVFVLSPVGASAKPRGHVTGVEMIPIKLEVLAKRGTKTGAAVSAAQSDLHSVIASLPKTAGGSYKGDFVRSQFGGPSPARKSIELQHV